MSLLKSSGKKNEQKSTPSPQPATPAPLAAATQNDYRELMRVLINPETNKIALEIDGTRYQAISEVKDRSIGQRILETAAGLLKFSGGYIATATGMKKYPVPEVEISTLPPETPTSISEPVTPLPSPEPKQPLPVEQPLSDQGARFSAQMEAQAQAITGPTATWPEPAQEEKRGFFNRNPEPEPTPDSAGFNLAEEIDEIVQQKLQQLNNPTKIKIHSGLGGMIQIEAGNRFYNAVDEIEDPGVRQIIQGAIEEWNKR